MANKKVKKHLDEFHYHEALDRIHIIMMMCDSHLMQHPVVKIESEIKQSVDAAIQNLWEAYQIVGQISSKRFKNE